MAHADGADGVAHEHAGVGRADRVLDRDGELQLPRGVLGVELLDGDTLARQRGQHVAAVVRHLGQPGSARRRAHGCRGGSRRRRPRRPPTRSRERARTVRPRPARSVDEPAQQEAAVGGVRRSRLLVALARRPRPAGLRVEDDEPVEVGDDPLVADRALAGRRRGHPVVGAEVVEGGGEADAPRGEVGEPRPGAPTSTREMPALSTNEVATTETPASASPSAQAPRHARGGGLARPGPRRAPFRQRPWELPGSAVDKG